MNPRFAYRLRVLLVEAALLLQATWPWVLAVGLFGSPGGCGGVPHGR